MASTTVQMPAVTMDRLLMAPSISPSSIALAVPSAWDEVPMAIPLAMGCVMRNSRRMSYAIVLPRMPVRMIEEMVSDT